MNGERQRSLTLAVVKKQPHALLVLADWLEECCDLKSAAEARCLARQVRGRRVSTLNYVATLLPVELLRVLPLDFARHLAGRRNHALLNRPQLPQGTRMFELVYTATRACTQPDGHLLAMTAYQARLLRPTPAAQQRELRWQFKQLERRLSAAPTAPLNSGRRL